MIATCTHCQARFQLEDEKVPHRVLKVRCPACQGVFTLDGTLREEPLADGGFGDGFETTCSSTPFSEPAPAAEPVSSSGPDFTETSFADAAPQEPVVADSPFGVEAPVAAGAEEEPFVEPAVTGEDFSPEVADDTSFSDPVVEIPDPEVEAAPAPETASVGVATLEEGGKSGGRRRRCKEEMLARALVSDILVYNRDTRDTALAEGKLLEVLGGEIKKSWELYKEKVTPEVANSTTYFREALNEILAEGDSVF